MQPAYVDKIIQSHWCPHAQIKCISTRWSQDGKKLLTLYSLTPSLVSELLEEDRHAPVNTNSSNPSVMYHRPCGLHHENN